MDMKRFFLYAIAIAALALAGCGGGGGGTTDGEWRYDGTHRRNTAGDDVPHGPNGYPLTMDPMDPTCLDDPICQLYVPRRQAVTTDAAPK